MGPAASTAFLAYAETVVAPDDGLPRVEETDAAAWFADYLARSPAANRIGLRALLATIDLAPLAGRSRARFARLDLPAREALLGRLERGPLGPGMRALQGLVQMAYYGDLAVLRAHGWDPEELVARSRALRAREARW